MIIPIEVKLFWFYNVFFYCVMDKGLKCTKIL